VFVIAVVWCLGCVATYGFRTFLHGSLLELLAGPLVLGFAGGIITSLVCLFSDWRRMGWRSAIPLGVCVVSFYFSGILVDAARYCVFIRVLPSYETVVREIDSGRILVTTNFVDLPQAKSEAPLAYHVFARRETNGVLMVEFDTESAFPLKHGGYLYSSSGTIEPGSRMDSRFPFRWELRKKWYYVSD